MINYIVDAFIGRGKFIVFIYSFIFIFIFAACFYILLMSLFGLTFSEVIYGAVGCGIGAGIVNAAIVAWHT